MTGGLQQAWCGGRHCRGAAASLAPHAPQHQLLPSGGTRGCTHLLQHGATRPATPCPAGHHDHPGHCITWRPRQTTCRHCIPATGRQAGRLPSLPPTLTRPASPPHWSLLLLLLLLSVVVVVVAVNTERYSSSCRASVDRSIKVFLVLLSCRLLPLVESAGVTQPLGDTRTIIMQQVRHFI